MPHYRIPSSFFIRIAGGRNTIFFTTSLLMIPAAGTGFALMSQDTPLWVFQLLALLSGLGGGNFASSMSNISFFYPKRKQGLALGLNAGLGNAGVTTMQLLIPLVMTFGVFGAGMVLETDSGTLIGKIEAGTETWIQNAGFVWLLFLIPLAVLIWTRMNNIRTDQVTPNLPSAPSAFAKITGMLMIALFTSVVGLWVILPEPDRVGNAVVGEVAGHGCRTGRHGIPPQADPGPGEDQPGASVQDLQNKHTWIMSVIYTMTFGSFIGFSAGFALAIKVIFGFKHIDVDGVLTHDDRQPGCAVRPHLRLDGTVRRCLHPSGRRLVGGQVRRSEGDPVRGHRDDHQRARGRLLHEGGLRLRDIPRTTSCRSSCSSWCCSPPRASATGRPSARSPMCSTRSRPDRSWAGPRRSPPTGPSSCPASSGPRSRPAHRRYALGAFAAFYVICLVLNWWYYLGPKAEFKNP